MSFAANSHAPKGRTVHESAGPITSDSLAAESLQNNGEFAQNASAAAMSVRGDQSTVANTDTSGARVLHAAPSGAAREEQDVLGAGADERGPAGLKLNAAGKPGFEGSHSEQGFFGASTQAQGSGGGARQGVATGASDFGASTLSSHTAGSGSNSQINSSTGIAGTSTSTATSASGSSGGPSSGTGARPYVPAAPGYTSSVTGAAAPEGTYRPKGANLEDADVTQSMPQTKTFTGNVGGVNDPGRLAEREFEGRNDDPVRELGISGVGGGRQRQQGEQGGESGQYGVLGSERA